MQTRMAHNGLEVVSVGTARLGGLLHLKGIELLLQLQFVGRGLATVVQCGVGRISRFIMTTT